MPVRSIARTSSTGHEPHGGVLRTWGGSSESMATPAYCGVTVKPAEPAAATPPKRAITTPGSGGIDSRTSGLSRLEAKPPRVAVRVPLPDASTARRTSLNHSGTSSS